MALSVCHDAQVFGVEGVKVNIHERGNTLQYPDLEIRELPVGEYFGKVVRTSERLGTYATGGTWSELNRMAEYHRKNTPYLLLRLADGRYVQDTAQEFKIGSVRGPHPELGAHYRIEIREYESSAILEDSQAGKEVIYHTYEEITVLENEEDSSTNLGHR